MFTVTEKLLLTKPVLTEVNLTEVASIWAPFDDTEKSDEDSSESDEIHIDPGNGCGSHHEGDVNHEIKKNKDNPQRWVIRKTNSIYKIFEFGEILGTPGQYGTVYNITRKSDGEIFAVKKFFKKSFEKNFIWEKLRQDLLLETYVMIKAKHHVNVVNIEAVYEDETNVFIVMEKLSGGELFDYLTNNRPINETKAANLFAQMINAVYYLHSLNVVHCDLKPENFMFDTKEPNATLKIIDFGMSKISKWRRYFNRIQGTPYYVAPEVLTGRYNESCDIWSLGVCLFVLVIGYPPFHSAYVDSRLAQKDLHRKIRNGFTPKILPKYGAWFPEKIPISFLCRDLIARLLRKNIADRVAISEIMSHAWINNTCTLPLHVVDGVTLKSIASFRKITRLQNHIMMLLYYVGFLNPSQEFAVRKDLRILDVNGDGVLDRAELLQSFRRVVSSASYKHVDKVFSEIDINKEGGLGPEHVISARIYRKVITKESRLIKLFNVLDLDNNGKLSSAELHKAFKILGKTTNGFSIKPLSMEECISIINESDTTGSGDVDFEEFMGAFGVNKERHLGWCCDFDVTSPVKKNSKRSTPVKKNSKRSTPKKKKLHKENN